jgi:hypothetical protein
MNSTATSADTHTENIGARLQRLAIAALFAVVLVVPKVLNLRRDERSWTAFRVLLGVAGAALVILPLAFWNSWLAAIAGLALFLTAALLPPVTSATTVDDKARELGALVVVNGGKYRYNQGSGDPDNQGSGAPDSAQLFVGSDYIWVLGSRLQTFLTLPVSEVSSVRAETIAGRWILRVRCADRVEEFVFGGIFAEHFARVAENTIRGVMHSALPILPRARAAGA